MKNILFLSLIVLMGCQHPSEHKEKMVHLITVDPGHFHAALVQKSMFADVDSVVHVYSSPGPDLQLHLDRIAAFNARSQAPTRWKEEVYSGKDFFEKMLEEKKGNLVVLSGNNLKKTEYISRCVAAGFDVLADKPMAIDKAGFQMLGDAFETARKKNVLLYDIMTERFEITTVLQKELSLLPDVFGTLEKGTAENPGVIKESVHYFHKTVSGKVLTRPAWFMDASQQGDGIVDVTTHLVDLVQWECFPGQSIDYKSDVKIIGARRWTTDMSLSQFKAITKLDDFPDYLRKAVRSDSLLPVYCNGEINYTLRGIHAKVSVRWNVKAPEGAGDSHYSIMRGTRANLAIRQGQEQHYIPALYIDPNVDDPQFEKILIDRFDKIKERFPGIELKKRQQEWEVLIPDLYRDGHEAHFGRVMENFLIYVKQRRLPDWEVPNMLAKYYTTTQALELATKK